MVVSTRCSVPSFMQASRMARISAWAVGIVRLGHLVGALGEHFAVLDDHRRERAAAVGHVAASQVDRPLREIGHGSSGLERGADNSESSPAGRDATL